MGDIHSRLKEIRSHFKMSIRDFSKEIYFSHGVYGQVECGRKEPNGRILQLICSRFDVNKDWILTGKGNMFIDNARDIRLEKILEIYNAIDDTLKTCLLDQSRILLTIHRSKNPTPD